jgi:hypothetical protein
MKLLLGMTMIAGLIAGAAQAANMPLKSPPRAYPAPEVGDWTGFYIGSWWLRLARARPMMPPPFPI